MKNIRGLHISYYINILGAIALMILAVFSLNKEKLGFLMIVDLVVMGVTILVAAYFGIRCILNAISFYRNDDLLSLRKHMKIGKRGLIPFFIINFIYYLLFFMILMAASRGIFLFGPIPMLLIPLVIFTYMSVLFTSSFSIAFILILRRKGKLDTRGMIFNIWLQLTFVLDIVGMLFLLRRFKKDDNVFSID